MPEVDSFDKLVSLLTKAESLSSKIEAHWAKIEKSSKSVGSSVGKFKSTGGQQGHGSSKGVTDASFGDVSDGGRLPGPGGLSGALGKVFGRRGGEGSQGSGFAVLPSENQARISTSNFGLGDTLSLMKTMSSASSNFFSDVGGTMNRATSYYNATTYGGNKQSREATRNGTFNTMFALNGISSAGSDANVAQYLAGRGMSFSTASKSAYQQTLRTVSNAARYMNISNEDAVRSVEGLTSAKGSANMLRNFGIYTADLNTGEEKSQGDIFKELADRLTAGRGQANVEQTQKSIRRGALGVTIDSFFQGDEQGAQMFKQYMVERAGGKTMDLSQNAKIDEKIGSAGNINPLNNQMTLAGKQTGAMNYAEKPYLLGINAATKALSLLTDVSGGLVQAFGSATAMIQTLFGNKTFSGMTEGLTGIVDYASKGLGSIGNSLSSMDALNPIPAVAQAGLTAGLMGLGLAGVAAIAGSGPTGGSNYGTGGDQYGVGGPGGAPPAQHEFDLGYLNNYKVTTVLGSVDDAHSSPHTGTDFGMGVGTEVKAVGDGQVIVAERGHGNEWPSGGLGNYVRILHKTTNGKTYNSTYAHLSDVLVSVNQAVTKGHVIGRSGNTGRSTGPHLHFMINEGDGPGGRAIPLNEASGLLGNGMSGAGTWTNNGSSGSSSSGYDPSAVDAAMAQGAKYQETPKAATDAMGILTGLYSGNTSKINSAVQAMAKSKGISAENWNAYMNAKDPALVNSGTDNGVTIGRGSAGSPVNNTNNVQITVQVPDVTSADAIKFGQLVKQYLETNTLTSNTGNM
jgi:hypothetical protein